MSTELIVAGAIVALSGFWLVGLASISAFAPATASRFLSGFAASARAHYLEQALRIIAGTGFILFAPEMRFPLFFQIAGWILVITSLGLLALPWQLHNRFAAWAVPFATRHLKLYALGAALLAGFIFYAML
ncbi:MAG: hypothetical protein HKM98_11060 [Gammaproteobacteria bacterium]|nr:hypothetical protein [Gammaproteobacteria bacterium]